MYCNNCPHIGKKAGECTFGGVCIIRNLNLHRTNEEPKVATSEEVVFNPFQRGNGCLLAGYTREEILKHTR